MCERKVCLWTASNDALEEVCINAHDKVLETHSSRLSVWRWHMMVVIMFLRLTQPY